MIDSFPVDNCKPNLVLNLKHDFFNTSRSYEIREQNKQKKFTWHFVNPPRVSCTIQMAPYVDFRWQTLQIVLLFIILSLFFNMV